MEMAENKLREHYICGSSISSFSMNTPEETDDETASVSTDMPSAGESRGASAQAAEPSSAVLSSAAPRTALLGAPAPHTDCGQLSRVPCESDESTSFIWNPSDRSTDELPGSSCNNSENTAASDYRIKQEKPANGLQERNAACAKREDVLAAAAAAQSTLQQTNTQLDSSCSSQGKSG